MNPAGSSAPSSPHLPVVSIKLFASPESQLHSEVEKDLYTTTALNKAKMSETLSKVVSSKKCESGKFSHHKLAFTHAKKRSPYFGKPTGGISSDRYKEDKRSKGGLVSLLNSKAINSTLSLSEAVAQAAAADTFATKKIKSPTAGRGLTEERESRPNPRSKRLTGGAYPLSPESSSHHEKKKQKKLKHIIEANLKSTDRKHVMKRSMTKSFLLRTSQSRNSSSRDGQRSGSSFLDSHHLSTLDLEKLQHNLTLEKVGS